MKPMPGVDAFTVILAGVDGMTAMIGRVEPVFGENTTAVQGQIARIYWKTAFHPQAEFHFLHVTRYLPNSCCI